MWLLGKVTRAPGDGFVPSGSQAERAPSGGATLILYQRRCRRHEPVMNMCHFTRRTLGGLAAQAWKIECLGLMILKMIESRLEMASPARPEEMETYLTAICPARSPTCPPTLHRHRGPCTTRTQSLIPLASPGMAHMVGLPVSRDKGYQGNLIP